VLAKATAPNGPFGGTNEDPTSSGVINSLARHYVSVKLEEMGLIDKYDRFVVTRTDQYYPCPLHLDELDISKIWIPNGEDWGGVCDRFIVVNSKDILKALSILKPAVLNPEQYSNWTGNIESFLKLRLQEEGLWNRVRRFRRSMFTASVHRDKTRWERARLPAFMVNGQTVRFKYQDEYFLAMTTCGLEE